MDPHTQDTDGSLIDRKDIAAKKKSLKSAAMEKLKETDWLDQMRLKCRAHIKDNQSKPINVDELIELLLPEAAKTFPKSVGEEISDMLAKFYEEAALDVYMKAKMKL